MKAQEREWAQKDERDSAAKDLEWKEQHANANAAIQRSFYTTFGLTWLLCFGATFASAGVGRKKPVVLEMQPGKE